MNRSNARVSIAYVLAGILLSGCQTTLGPVKTAEVRTPITVAKGADARLIQFHRMAAKIPLGDEMGQFLYGWGCMPGSVMSWRGGKLNITDEELIEAFRKELEAHNYPVVGNPYALFGDPSAGKAEIFVAGLFEKVDLRVCFPFSGSPNANIGSTNTSKGEAFMRVTWQVYSSLAEKVVYEVTTEGSYKTTESIAGGLPAFLRNTFSANVRNLLADPGFNNLVLRSKSPDSALIPRLPVDDVRFSGGDGSSCGRAIVLNVKTSLEAVRAETEWLRQKYGGGRKAGQALLQDSGKWFDSIEWEAPNGAKSSTCFDITKPHEALLRGLQERK